MNRYGNSTVRLTTPLVYPISVPDVRTNSNLPHNADDSYIEDQVIPAACEYVERLARYAINPATYRQSWRDFPCQLVLEVPPVQSVVSLTYTNTAGTRTTLATDQYRVDYDANPATIEEAYGISWPDVREQSGAVQVTYRAGFGDPFTANATSNAITPANGQYYDGDLLAIRNYGGALPGGLTAGNYFVVNADADAGTVKLSATIGGSAIDLTSAGTGLHLIGEIPKPYVRVMLMLASYWYEHRTAFNTGSVTHPIGTAIENLIAADGMREVYA